MTVPMVLVVLTLALLLPATELELSTDLRRLLPAGSPTARAFDDLFHEFSSAETVFVAVRARPASSGDMPVAPIEPRVEENELLEAVWQLEESLSGAPGVASVRSGLGDEEERFFFDQVLPYGALLLEEEEFEAVLRRTTSGEALRARARLIRRQALIEGAAPWLEIARSDPLGLVEFLPIVDALGGGLPLHPLTGSFLSADSSVALLVVEPRIDTAAGLGPREFLDLMESAIAETRLQLEDGLGDRLQFLPVGGPVYAATDERAVRGNLVLTVGSSALGCLLVLWWVFGSWREPTILLLSVGSGLIWLFAVLRLAGVSLSALGLGFAAVLVGLGVDYGVHAVSAYRRALGKASSVEAAWSSARRDLRGAVGASVATTGAGFAVLLLADLRLLRDVGLVVSLGIVSVALATWFLGGALLQLLFKAPQGSHGQAVGAAASGGSSRGWKRVEHWLQRRPRVVLLVAVAVVLVLAPGIRHLVLYTDLQDLRPTPGLQEAEQVAARAFGIGSETANLIIAGTSEHEALARARRAAAVLRQLAPAGSEVVSAADILRSDKAVKRRLEQIKEVDLAAVAVDLRTALRSEGLDPRAFARGLDALHAMARGDARQFGASPPAWLSRSLVRRADGEVRLALQLRLPSGAWRKGPPEGVAQALEEAAPRASWASFARLAEELELAAAGDLATLGPVALLVVLFLVVASLPRHVPLALLAVLPVAVATLCTLGIWGWLGWPVDLVSLAVLPIVLGIGIDDGLHVAHRAARSNHGGNESSLGGLTEAVRGVVRPVTVTTATTCVGFGSLALSNLEAVRRAGLIVVVGVLLSWAATLGLLTALGVILRGQGPLEPNEECDG